MSTQMDDKRIDQALELLGSLLEADEVPPIELVVCGGAALSLSGLHRRTTKDVDVVALFDAARRQFTSPEPLPGLLLIRVSSVAEELELPGDWLNNGPSRDAGGLYQMGLPEGMADRLIKRDYGRCLTVHLISRVDQIHFKFYAAVDQPSSYHTSDLRILGPSSEEIESALHWAVTHDVSESFLAEARKLLTYMGYRDVARRV